MRLVQITHKIQGRKLALVEEPKLGIINGFESVYALVSHAIANDENISALVRQNLSDLKMEYEPIYNDHSDWKLLPCFDHPYGHLGLMLSGTGLTHKASAENRQKMHRAKKESELTDSMKMYLMGVEKGHPIKGGVGVQPEWFYKGNGSILRAHNEPLEIPYYGDDGGEEPEIAGVYLNDPDGKPWRIGFATANEFSDHIMERKNYLYLAPSKIRNCSIGPELVINSEFRNHRGKVTVIRKGETFWEKDIRSGEDNMAHSLSNLEYHHFKYSNHRIPQQAHIHFYGADAFSFGDQIRLEEEDIMQIKWEGMGRPLRNTLKIAKSTKEVIKIDRLT